MKHAEVMPGKKVLSPGAMLLAVFALIVFASLDLYAPPVQAAGLRGMKRSPEQITARLKDRLNLTAEQTKQIEPIIRESMAKRRELVKEMQQLRQSTDTRINAVLTKKQAIEFQKIRDRRRARMWKRAGHR
ncbi:MAG: hypothetical protein P8013_04050 [Candidatus Sulfobium sp.]|jgi:Spy/CpxP family protein refolding chaperone